MKGEVEGERIGWGMCRGGVDDERRRGVCRLAWRGGGS